MNQAQAITAAKAAGIKVTAVKILKAGDPSRKLDCPREFYVGNRRVHHDANGGKACWNVDGERRGYVAEAIVWATANQK